jgi:hypothetical protein
MKINDKYDKQKILIVEKHHQVLEAWEKHKGCDVITLDSHKDTMNCFRNYLGENPQVTSEELINSYIDGNMNILDIIKNLKHDEHIDFAIRSNMINKVFAIAYVFDYKHENPAAFHKGNIGAPQNIYNNEPIIQYNNENYLNAIYDYENNNYPEEDKYTYIRKHALSNEVLDDAINSFKDIDSNCLDNYILDIDLDYICTIYAFDTDLTTFKDLIKNAKTITIAKESNCVKDVNEIFKDELDKETEDNKYLEEILTAEIILEKILNIIELSNYK